MSANSSPFPQLQTPVASDNAPRSLVATLSLVIVALSLLVYLPALRNGFVDLDDPAYVTQNDHVRTGLNWRNVSWAFTSTDAANWHPITWLSHMLDSQLFGLHPAGHHAVNVVFHAANALLLFLLLQKATRLPWRSFFVAALFAVHPLNVETVAWVAERKSLLCMFFSLLCAAAYAKFADSRRWTNYLSVVVCFALALLSKPMAVTLPVLLLLLDYWPLQRFPRLRPPRTLNDFFAQGKPLLIEKLPLFAMSAASSSITIVAQRGGHAVTSVIAIPIWQRVENAAYSYVKYVLKIFWPARLAYIYPHPAGTLPPWKITLYVLLLCGITVLVWRFRERRHLVFGWFLYLIALLPVIGIIQVGLQGMADRYAYLPSIGIFVIVVWELSEAASLIRVPRPLQVGLAAVILAMLSSATVANARYWKNNLALFTHAYQVTSPPYFQIEVNLGAALADAGKPDEALQHFRKAEQIGPDLFTPHFNVGYLLSQSGDNEAAVPELLASIRCATNPREEARAWNALAVVYLDQNKNENAAGAFSKLLSIVPNSRAGFAGRGQANFNMGRFQEASQDFERASQLQPAPGLYLLAGKALEAAGQLTPAADYYRRALQGDPQLTEAQQRLVHLQQRLAAK